MTNYIPAEEVQCGHYIINPLPLQGEGPWAKVKDVRMCNGHIEIQTARFFVRKSPRESVTVLFDLEKNDE